RPPGYQRERGRSGGAPRADGALQGDGLLRLRLSAGHRRRTLFLQGRFHSAVRCLRPEFIDRSHRPRDAWRAMHSDRASARRLSLRGAARLALDLGHFRQFPAGDFRRPTARYRAVRADRAHGLALSAMAIAEKGARMTALLAIENLSKRFGGLAALQNVSFEVEEHEILGLIGPNGAGKSTLFNLVNGVFKPDTGRIVFRGADITGMAPYLVAHAGLARTHQIVQPLGAMTVHDNCTVGACFGREYLPLSQARRGARQAARLVRPRRPRPPPP